MFALAENPGAERQIGAEEDCGTCASVSDDGEHVVTLTLAPDRRFTFVVMRSDGTDRRIFALPAGMSFGPGPYNGSSIYVGGWDDNKPQVDGIYSIAAGDLSGLRQVTRTPVGERDIPAVAAPDGSHLLVFRPKSENGEHGNLFVVDTRDGTGRQLNVEGTRVAWIPSIGVPGSFSPDSKRVTFAAYEGDQGNNADPDRSAVFVAEVSGGTAARIASLGTGTTSARWSGAADVIAFQRRDAGQYHLFLIRPDGSAERAMAEATVGSDVSAWGPVWSPSGSWLVFQRGTHLKYDLWFIGEDGAGLARLTSHPAGYGGVLWAR